MFIIMDPLNIIALAFLMGLAASTLWWFFCSPRRPRAKKPTRSTHYRLRSRPRTRSPFFRRPRSVQPPHETLSGLQIARQNLTRLITLLVTIKSRVLSLAIRFWNILPFTRRIEVESHKPNPEITIVCSCPHSLFHKIRPLAGPQEMFYLEDIISGQAETGKELAVLELIGDIIALPAEDIFTASTTRYPQYFTNLQSVVIYWTRCPLCPLENLIPVFAQLLANSPRLNRFSLWTSLERSPDDHYIPLLKMDPLLAVLQQTSVSKLHFNGNFEGKPNGLNLYLGHLDAIQALLPQLTELTLGSTFELAHTTAHQHLPTLVSSLKSLKLDWPALGFCGIFDLIPFAKELGASTGGRLTTLALKKFPEIAIAILCQHLPTLTMLKLMGEWEDLAALTPDLAESLKTLPSLTELILLEYTLLPGQPIQFPLPSITKLTLTNSILLFEHFYTEVNADDPENPRLDVTTFGQLLLEQFPSLQQLTLIGPIFESDQIEERLKEELPEQIEVLVAFTVNSTTSRIDHSPPTPPARTYPPLGAATPPPQRTRKPRLPTPPPSPLITRAGSSGSSSSSSSIL